ncbi:unnamed protein product [Rhizoctonia solani]|uniref:ATP-dependent DNA helicase PIF1 n=1 Tax=Rhizoctonia solani TaxID=456999 RepID=A0A8H3BP43_9AGAM|nr:unnamed protein product [Rhizoctonia solani]
MLVRLSSQFRRYGIRPSNLRPGNAARYANNAGIKFYYGGTNNIGKAFQPRYLTRFVGAVQYRVNSPGVAMEGKAAHFRRPPRAGHSPKEQIAGPTRDVLAVQRYQTGDDMRFETKPPNQVISIHKSRFPNQFHPELSEEQRHILERVLQGESVFFTGSAGTGKSVLLRSIIAALGGPSDKVAVTSSTGISATHIGGQTLHSFAGVGLGHGDLGKLVSRIKGDWTAFQRWSKVKVLIIDEISMVDATWFDQLEEISRRIRKKSLPFGGIQLVICGDFFQLPPVPNRDIADAPASFVFDSWSWDRCIKSKFMLTQVFRQKDPRLVKMLNDARVGIVTDESAKLLRSLSRPVHYEDGIGPTEIYPRRFEADWANRKQLLALPGERRVYSAYDSYGKDDDGEDINPERAARLFSGMLVPKLLPLKVGAQVMCLRNIRENGLVNGSIGRVVDFMTPTQVRTYAESKDRWSIVTSIKQPKSSGQTEVSAVDARVPGEATRSVWSHELYERSEWPLVQFTDGQCVMMGPTNFTIETRQGVMEVRRLQVPLVLAWALTVHKSQGQTMERVKINLQRTFEKGQAYVALSRCTSLETLEVNGFDRERSVQAHPRVQQWVKTLITLNRFLPATPNSTSAHKARARERGLSQ